jgi:hypothetical protein
MNPRRFTTRSSAHGSDYVKEHEPERFTQTREEAEQEVKRWRIFADTVGGDAIVVENINGFIILKYE